MQNKTFITNKTLTIQGRLVDLQTPRVMGILNVTPDSFYATSRTLDQKALLTKAEKMLQDGATFLDVGGYSSRPGAEDISEAEELNRVIPAIQALQRAFPEALLSVDTFRSAVAQAAVQEGASLINDISGGTLDPAMYATVAKAKVPYILMHLQGTPQTMTTLTNYNNLVVDVITHLAKKKAELVALGITDVLIDPGFGFAKTVEQNFHLLNHLDHFKIVEAPLVVGLSRKSMIWRTLSTTPELSLNGTTTLNTVALLKGVSVLRVHDVKEATEAITLLAHLV